MSLRSASVLTVISLAALTAAACSPKLAPSRDAPNPPVSGPPLRVDVVDPVDQPDGPPIPPADAPVESVGAESATAEAGAPPVPEPAPTPVVTPVVHVMPESVAGESELAHAEGTHCHADERTLYSCPFSDGRVASVCVGDEIAYRFGPLGDPELDLTRELDARSVRYGARSREGDERQSHVRFQNGAYDYVVYSGEQAGAGSSGVVVQHGRETIRRLECPVASVQTAIPVAMIRDSLNRERRDGRYDIWW